MRQPTAIKQWRDNQRFQWVITTMLYAGARQVDKELKELFTVASVPQSLGKEVYEML